MPAFRPRLLRRRDKITLALFSAVALFNFASTMIVYLLIRPRVIQAESIASQSAMLCDTSLNEARVAISNCISYLAYRDVLESQTATQSPAESPDDVVGVLGYGQSHNDISVWIYRDDLLRDGRSRRSYLKRIPKH